MFRVFKLNNYGGIRSAGFTLIEGIIAIGIIGSALIVGLALAYSNLQAAKANADRILATHLAREGLEVVRNMRDSNWMRRDENLDKNNNATDGVGTEPDFYNWNDLFENWPTMSTTCLTDASCYNAYYDIVLTNTTFQPTAPYYTLKKAQTNTNALGCMNPVQTQCRVQKNASSIYFQSTVGTSYTPYFRRIILQPICLDSKGTAPADDDTMYVDVADATPNNFTDNCAAPSSAAPVGVLVTSHVAWQSGAKVLEVKLKERLYNWRNL